MAAEVLSVSVKIWIIILSGFERLVDFFLSFYRVIVDSGFALDNYHIR